MSLMAIPCTQCGEQAGLLKVEVPNPDLDWCSVCHQHVGTHTKDFFFCSPKCMWKWVEGYYQAAPYLIEAYLRHSKPKASDK